MLIMAEFNLGFMQDSLFFLLLFTITAHMNLSFHDDCDFDGDGCYNGFCYEFVSQANTYSDAKQKCTNILNYELLSIHSQEEADFVAQLLCTVNATSEVWTSGYTRILDENYDKLTWRVRNMTMMRMDWMAPLEDVSPFLYGHPATIIISNNSAYSTWSIVTAAKTYRHALCKRRISASANAWCPITGTIFEDVTSGCKGPTHKTTPPPTPPPENHSTPDSTSISTVTPEEQSNSSSTTMATSSSTGQSTSSLMNISKSTPENHPNSPSTTHLLSHSKDPSTSVITTMTTSYSTDYSTSTSTSDSASSSTGKSTSASTSQSTFTSTKTSTITSMTTSSSTDYSSSTSTIYSTSTYTRHPSSSSTGTSTTTSKATSYSTEKSTSDSTSQSTSTSAELSTTSEQSNVSGCPATYSGGCNWPPTDPGKTAVINCPSNSSGIATWYCDPETMTFQPEDSPDFSNCEHDWVNDMETDISGEKSALELAESLWKNASITDTFYSKDLSVLQLIMLEMDKKFLNETGMPLVITEHREAARNYSQYLIFTCDILLDTGQATAWNQLNEERPLVADQLTGNVEKVGFILASSLDNDQDNVEGKNVALFVERRPKDVYDGQGYQFIIDDDLTDNWKGTSVILADGFHKSTIGNYTSVVTILYSNMQGYLGDTFVDLSVSAEVITNILGVSIGPAGGQSVQLGTGGIQYRIPYFLQDTTHYHICSFWNSTRPTSGSWDSNGCVLVSQDDQSTTCSCNHLTNFAILLDINGIVQNMSPLTQEILNLLTVCCGCLSAVCLVICLVVFYHVRTLGSLRTSITKNLCICLLIEDLLILTVLQLTGNKVLCGIIAGTLDYVLLSAFMWMLIEGIHLYRLMIHVFETNTRTLIYYYMLGYGIPFLIVAIAAAIYPEGFGTNLYCWLDDKLIWSFAVPVAIVILINIAMLILALRTASRVQQKRTQTKLAQFRKYVTGAISLTSILGITWMFGFFYVNQSTVVFAYIFTILNASQGVIIFIFHCIVNESVRNCVLGYFARCTHNKIPKIYTANDGRPVKKAKETNENQQDLDGTAVWTLTNSTSLAASVKKGNAPELPIKEN